METEKNFGEDIAFLKDHVETIVLRGESGAAIAVVPAYQGRTMTSSTGGDSGNSFGWINYDQIASDQIDRQINLYGGEDRMWLGPEGGQFSLFFDPDAPMDFAHWRTPAPIDVEPFEILRQDASSVSFSRTTAFTNYARFEFKMRMEREVRLLDSSAVEAWAGCSLDNVQFVGHESDNRVVNVGDEAWTPSRGLPGIWMLCMNKPAKDATLIVPFKRGDVSELGPIVNADYFGTLDESRLQIDEAAGLIYFLGDGRHRSKLGLTFPRAEPRLGSWDASREILTIVEFNLPAQVPFGYTNNVWEMQEEPFNGDVINGYNDGPNESGGMLGPFYELETLSPALALAPDEGYTHRHRTVRMEGARHGLDRAAQSLFGVGLDEIENRF